MSTQLCFYYTSYDLQIPAIKAIIETPRCALTAAKRGDERTQPLTASSTQRTSSPRQALRRITQGPSADEAQAKEHHPSRHVTTTKWVFPTFECRGVHCPQISLSLAMTFALVTLRPTADVLPESALGTAQGRRDAQTRAGQTVGQLKGTVKGTSLRTRGV